MAQDPIRDAFDQGHREGLKRGLELADEIVKELEDRWVVSAQRLAGEKLSRTVLMGGSQLMAGVHALQAIRKVFLMQKEAADDNLIDIVQKSLEKDKDNAGETEVSRKYIRRHIYAFDGGRRVLFDDLWLNYSRLHHWDF